MSSASTRDLDRYVATAIQMVDLARPILMRWFRSGLAAEAKADASPVTMADRECEQVLRSHVQRSFPDHGLIGEEHGNDRDGASYVWVIDPIDGTKAFVSGRPLFGTLVALCRDGEPVLGIIDCPAVGDRWIGVDGRPTTHNGNPCRARPCPGLGDALMYSTSPYMFEGNDAAAYERLRSRVRYPLFGGDCHSYGLAASGWVDLVVEAQLKVYDWTALVPVARGAGAVLTDWSGAPLGLHSDGRVVMAGDARVHRQALEALAR